MLRPRFGRLAPYTVGLPAGLVGSGLVGFGAGCVGAPGFTGSAGFGAGCVGDTGFTGSAGFGAGCVGATGFTGSGGFGATGFAGSGGFGATGFGDSAGFDDGFVGSVGLWIAGFDKFGFLAGFVDAGFGFSDLWLPVVAADAAPGNASSAATTTSDIRLRTCTDILHGLTLGLDGDYRRGPSKSSGENHTILSLHQVIRSKMEL